MNRQYDYFGVRLIFLLLNSWKLECNKVGWLGDWLGLSVGLADEDGKFEGAWLGDVLKLLDGNLEWLRLEDWPGLLGG